MGVQIPKRPTASFILSLTGCFFLVMPNSLTWYWGNMSIYVYSYIHYHKNTDSHEVKAPWVLSIYIIMWGIGMLLTGQLTRCFNNRYMIALGILFFNGGILLSYFVLDKSITYLDFTLGLCSGLGNGLIFSLVMQNVVNWAEERVGFTTSIVVMGGSVGAVLINQFITYYVNPKNLKVDTVIGRTKFFSQKEILERVPSMFLILLAMNFSCHFIGFCLSGQKPPKDNKTDNEGSDNSDKEHSQEDKKDPTINYTTPLLGPQQVIDKPKLVSLFNQGKKHEPPKPTNLHPHIQNYDEQINPPDDVAAQDNQTSKAPSQVLASRSFYILWFMLFCSDMGYIIICNYYKAFGQTHIKNDHFLTILGTSLSVVNIVTRPVWGICLDYIPLKTSLVAFIASLSMINCFYFFTLTVSKWLFFFWSIAYGSLASGLYINFAITITRLYGKEHFHTNLGLVFTATIAVNLIAPPIFRAMLRHWGWSFIFITPAGFGLISLLLIVIFL